MTEATRQMEDKASGGFSEATEMSQNQPRKWTKFEKHALLCIMARYIHKTGLHKHKDPTETPTMQARKRAAAQMAETGEVPSVCHEHMDVSDLLNTILHGSGKYDDDIDKVEVSRMIDKLVVENKGALAYMDRQTAGRLTRGMKKVWERRVDHDDSLREKNTGRKRTASQACTEASLRMLNGEISGITTDLTNERSASEF